MASFVEQATLKVNDQSTAQIKKINAALKQLFATAKSLKSIKIDLKVNDSGINKASAAMRKLAGEAKNLKNVKLKVDVNGINQANAAIKRLTASLNQLHSVRPINVRANTSQAQGQINRLRAQAARPITIGSALRAGAALGVGRYVANQGKEGVKQADLGSTNLDMLQLKERRKWVNEEVSRREQELKDLPGPYQFARGHIEQRMAENLREVREGEAGGLDAKTGKTVLRIPNDPSRPQDVGDPNRSRLATAAEQEAESRRRTNIAGERTYQEMVTADQIAKDTGVSASQALEKIKGYYKALDMAGQLSDETGQNSVERIKSAGDFIRTMRGAIGEEATGQFLATLVRREKAAKFSLDQRGQLAVAFVAEDMGPATAGTAFSTWQNQVQGARLTNAARKYQVKAGLATNGRMEGKKYVAETVDDELAQRDPLAYARKHYVPALKKLGMSEKEIFSDDPKDIAKMSNHMRKLYSETNAANFGISLMTHLLEMESKARDASTRASDPKSMAEASKYSIWASTNAINSAVGGVMGQTAVAFAPLIAGTADILSDGMNKATDDIRLAGDRTAPAADRVQAGARAATTLALAAGGAAFAVKTTSALLSATGVTDTIARTGGLMALMSKDPAQQAAGGAGLALLEAAAALKDAAGALKMASGIPGGGPDVDIGGGPGGGSKGGFKKAPWYKRLWEWSVKHGKTIAGGVATVASGVTAGGVGAGAAAAIPAAVAYELVTTTPEEKAAAREVLANVEALGEARRKLRNNETEGKILKGGKQNQQVKVRLQELERENKRLAAEIAQREAAKERNERLLKGGADASELTPEEQAAEAEKERKAKEDQAVEEARIAEEKAKQLKKDLVKPPPGSAAALAADAAARAEAGTEVGTPVSAAAAAAKTEAKPPGVDLATLMPQLAATSNSIMTAATQFSSTTSLFAAAFSTGASQLTAAGQTAADIISAGASAAGTAYGSAAAAQIAAAVANVNINVNQSGGGPSTAPNKVQN